MSVGEVNLLGPLLAEIGSRRPDWQCVVSTTTQTGYALARRRYPQSDGLLLPAGFQLGGRGGHCGEFGRRLLVLAELELWPNLIRLAQASGAKRGGRQRPAERAQLSRLSPHLRGCCDRCCAALDLIAVQTEEYAQRFLALGRRPERGRSHRLDQIRRRQDRSRQSRRPSGCGRWPASRPTTWCSWPAARKSRKSSWPWKPFAGSSRRIRGCDWFSSRGIPSDSRRVAALLAAAGVAWQRRTDLDHRHGRSGSPGAAGRRVGELGAWWGTAAIGFVGGSLSSAAGRT